jgi:hypothetical protein
MTEIKNSIQSGYQNLTNKVKVYKKQLANSDKDMIEKTRFYPFVEQKKFYFEEKMIIKLLVDSLARVTNSFHKDLDSEDGLTLVLAIYFKSSFEEFNSKMKLEKIYFSQKGRCAFVSQNLLNIINYCFGKSDRFIVNRNKLLIRDYLQKIERTYKINLKTMDSIENEDTDVDIMKNLFIDLSSMKPGHELNEDVYQMVHYLTILFFDYIFLKTFFEKYFELDKDFDTKNIEEIQYDDKNIHPDVIIPLKLYENSIGILFRLCATSCV